MGVCVHPDCGQCRPLRTPEQQAACEAMFPAVEEQYLVHGRPCAHEPLGVINLRSPDNLVRSVGKPIKLSLEPKQKLKPKTAAGNRRQRRAEKAKQRKGN